MAAPEFVVADAPFKVYPGGVIALRCADWLGGARGSLSTESDARSVTGTVVRDTQAVATDIQSGMVAAYAEADATLEIPLADLPIEEGMYYLLMVSYLTEGDWDVGNAATIRGASQDVFRYTCQLRIGGVDVDGFNDTAAIDHAMYRLHDGYRYVGFDAGILAVDPADTMTVKAYAQAGTTVEWLIDQIVMLPHVFSGTVNDEWRQDDFRIVGGGINASENVYSLDPDNVGPGDYPVGWEDGADGGDDNGKFTWWPILDANHVEPFTWGLYGDVGGGDFQKDDSEYMARVTADLNDDGVWSDFIPLNDSRDDERQEPPSHCYGVHGAIYRSARTLVVEDFSRDTGGNHDFQDPDTTPTFEFENHEWGRTPEGYYWSPKGIYGPVHSGADGHNHGIAIYCNADGQGVITVRRGEDPLEGGVVLRRVNTAAPETGAGISIPEGINITGTFEIENAEPLYPDSTPHTPQVLSISTRETTFSSQHNGLTIGFDMRTGRWVAVDSPNTGMSVLDTPPGGGDELYHGPIDVSSWWDYGVEVGFRLEVHRFWYRAKVWEASAGEPGTWDFEGFRMGGIAHVPYDYDDVLFRTIELGQAGQTVAIEMSGSNHRYAGSYIAYFNSLQVDYDPAGEEAPTWASMEVPDGNEVGRIEIPVGAQQFVYWGRRAWSTWSDWFEENMVEFSNKMWNDPDAAELQRADAVIWYFRSVHAGGVMSMNWSSAKNYDIRRVHQ